MELLKRLKSKSTSLKRAKDFRLVIFDLDHTLISVASSYHYVKTLYRKGILSLRQILQAVFIRWKFFLTSMSLEDLHHLVFEKMLKGFSLDDLEAHVEELIRELLPMAIYEPAFRELKIAQKQGDYIVLLSSAPDFLVRAFASYFEIEHWECTVYAVDKRKRLCDIANLMVGSKKMQSFVKLRTQLGISKEQTVVYSDSYDDLPLFLQAGQPIAVNPDRKLAKIARKLHWRVI